MQINAIIPSPKGPFSDQPIPTPKMKLKGCKEDHLVQYDHIVLMLDGQLITEDISTTLGLLLCVYFVFGIQYPKAAVLNSSPGDPPPHFACLTYLTHRIQIMSFLEKSSMNELCSDLHGPYTVSLHGTFIHRFTLLPVTVSQYFLYCWPSTSSSCSLYCFFKP